MSALPPFARSMTAAHTLTRGIVVMRDMRLPLCVLMAIGVAGSANGAPLDDAGNTAPDARSRFVVLDANRDGVLSRYEYDSDVVFEAADRNHDQLLSADELTVAMGPQAPDSPTAPERMIAVDLDRDGQLDDAELRRALEMRFSWLDRNAD